MIPTCFNLLNSSAITQKAVAGINGTENGSPSYESCFFGNGVRTAASKHVDLLNLFSTYTGLRVKGCIEFWAKHTQNSSSYVRNDRVFDAEYGGIHLTWGEVYNNNRFEFRADDNGPPYSYVVVESSAASYSAGDKTHFACVWDLVNHFGGTQDIRLYINGNLDNAIYHAPASPVNSINTNTNYLRIGDSAGSPVSCDMVIENFKIWSYPKTDFSDRFYPLWRT